MFNVRASRPLKWAVVSIAVVAAGAIVRPITPTQEPPPPGAVVEKTPPPITPPSAIGPQTGVTCPAGAVDVSPGTKIQAVVNAHSGRTTFCLKAGVHPITSAITPKTGNTFVGEYGAILDGSDWTTNDSTQGAFRAHNEDIDDVTIRNLVIRKMPQRGIHAFSWASDRWTIEYNEITWNRVGVLVPNGAVVRNNFISRNVGNPASPIPAERGGGYIAYQTVGVTFEDNELAYNGSEQKVTLSTNVTFRRNYVHHNLENGIWYDGDNVESLIESNTVEDNPAAGIFYEISGRGVIRNNAVRRSGGHGVLVSTSSDVEIHDNILENNFRGIQYYVSCTALGGGALRWDLANNSAHHNVVRVGSATDAFATGFSHTPDCAPAQLAPYLNGSKHLTFADNRYLVPATAGKYWLWGPGGLKSFGEWHTVGHDLQGSVAQVWPGAN